MSLLDVDTPPAADSVPSLRQLLLKVQRRHAQLACQAAHELRTPLTAQRCIAEKVLLEGATAEQLEAAIVAMLEESRHMEQLIETLLLVAQANGGLLEAPCTTIDASRVAVDAVRSIEPVACQHQHPISVRLTGAQFIVADAVLLRQVLLNLIHNAILHTPVGTRIQVSVQARPQGQVVLAVVDDGPGMSTCEPGQAAPRFARRREDRDAHVSLGLGLTIAKWLVRSQGGRTRIVSKPGAGTAVCLVFAAASEPIDA
ncbi:sensor histidine kinase [Piscinibacter terrae]|nr:HAMP domain-containing sensor histidine kinase [Albitalea terrae]